MERGPLLYESAREVPPTQWGPRTPRRNTKKHTTCSRRTSTSVCVRCSAGWLLASTWQELPNVSEPRQSPRDSRICFQPHARHTQRRNISACSSLLALRVHLLRDLCCTSLSSSELNVRDNEKCSPQTWSKCCNMPCPKACGRRDRLRANGRDS